MTAALCSLWLQIFLRKSLGEASIKCNYLWKANCGSQFKAIYCWITRKRGVFSDASRKSLPHSHTNPPCLDCSVLKKRSVGKKKKKKLSWTGGFRDTRISFFVVLQSRHWHSDCTKLWPNIWSVGWVLGKFKCYTVADFHIFTFSSVWLKRPCSHH